MFVISERLFAHPVDQSITHLVIHISLSLILIMLHYTSRDRLCGLVVRVSATDTEVPGSIPGATRFSE